MNLYTDICILLNKYFLRTLDINMEIPVAICFIIVSIFLLYLSRVDLRYRKIDKIWLIFIFYIPTIFSGYCIYGFTTDFVVGLISLFIYLYIVSVTCDVLYNYGKEEKDRIVFVGTADILVAPLCSTWFGLGVIIQLVLFLLIMALSQIKSIKVYLNSLCLDSDMLSRDRTSLIPCMFITFLITLFLFLL